MDGLIDRLENKGILTFESLYRYVLTKEDLVKIIGKEFTKIYGILWNEIENQQKDLMTSQYQNTPNPAFSTPSIPPVQPNNITPSYQGNEDEGKTSQTEVH